MRLFTLQIKIKIYKECKKWNLIYVKAAPTLDLFSIYSVYREVECEAKLAFHGKKCTLLRFSSAWKLLDLLYYSLAASACVCVRVCVGQIFARQIYNWANRARGDVRASSHHVGVGVRCANYRFAIWPQSVARGWDRMGWGGKKRIACKINADSWVSA